MVGGCRQPSGDRTQKEGTEWLHQAAPARSAYYMYVVGDTFIFRSGAACRELFFVRVTRFVGRVLLG